jgi:putative ABC transport system ATP-binding protein
VNDPSVVLADEPTGNLDQTTGQGIIALFEELKERLGITLVVVTHDPSVSARAWREVRLVDGRVQSDVVRGRAKTSQA